MRDKALNPDHTIDERTYYLDTGTNGGYGSGLSSDNKLVAPKTRKVPIITEMPSWITEIRRLSRDYNEIADICCPAEISREGLLAEFIKAVIARETPLPDAAPELYKDRHQRAESPIGFIKRVYGEWIGKGLTQPYIRRMDEPLYMAMYNWLRKNDMPSDFDLPTKSEILTRELATTPRKEVRNARRLAQAAYRRDKI